MTLDLAFMYQILPDMLAAFWLTIKISLITVIASVIIGIFLTAFRMMGSRISRYLIIAFVEFTRGAPPLVHISIIYFLFPEFGIVFNEFWTQRDPTPGTYRNELKEEFFKRVDFANQNFPEIVTGREGWETDRGKIYIKNGPPDELDRQPTEINMPTAEIWFYAKQNKRFIFSDRQGNGVYRLVKVE